MTLIFVILAKIEKVNITIVYKRSAKLISSIYVKLTFLKYSDHLLSIIEAGVDNSAPAAGLRDALDLGEVAGLHHDLQVAEVLVDVDREEELVLLGLGHETLVLLVTVETGYSIVDTGNGITCLVELRDLHRLQPSQLESLRIMG